MTLSRLLLTTAIATFSAGFVLPVSAQVTISDDRTTPVDTATEGDITIDSAGSITITTGTAVTLNSDNNIQHNGEISSEDADNTTGILIGGGNTGNVTVGGRITLNETFAPTDTDSSGTIDGTFAEGTGRTGILISGASPFIGNVTLENASDITIAGNDSFGIQLASGAGLMGDLTLGGAISVLGTNGIGVDVASDIVGNLASSGRIGTRGENAQAIRVSGDIDGAFTQDGIISNTGYRFTDRPRTLASRDLLDSEDLLQAGAAVEVGGNVTGGIHFRQARSAVLDADGNATFDEDGNPITQVTAVSSVSQIGQAPAILIDGNGTPIAIGRVATITNAADPDYDAALLYAFINEGTLSSAGIYNDINATAFEVRDATLTDGISNTGNITSATLRSGDDGSLSLTDIGHARVIVIGSGAIADQINNTGVILASSSEATDEIYADRDNIIAARDMTATAIDIEANGNLASLTNIGSISAVILGRNGDAVAVRDASGTLIQINNSGSIEAVAGSSDVLGLEATNFNVIALDLSANTTGVTINQTPIVDTDLTDAFTPTPPRITGDILLGSGADTLVASAGSITGDLAFGAGADILSLANTSYSGALSDSDGALTIALTNGASLTNTSTDTLNITSATFDSSSTYSPTLDGSSGLAGALVASNDITFEDGATISPSITNVVDVNSASFVIANANNLTINGTLNGLNSGTSPFLYNTSYSLSDPNTLVVTLDLRTTQELGLDGVQSGAFNSAFDALRNNSGLANALVNIQDADEFYSAYNQLLPEFSAASRQYVIANVDGAVGAVGSHLDSARRSQEKRGGAWLQQFAYFADRDLAGRSEQYRGHGFGFTGGFDTSLGPIHTVGINLGFASTEIEDVAGLDDPMDVVTVQAGLYAAYSTGGLGIEAYGGGGYNDFETNRVVAINDFNSTASGDWSGIHYNGTLRAGYEIPLGKKFWARPSASLDYLSLTEEAYTEEGDLGVAFSIDERTTDSMSGTAMFNLGAEFMGKRTWIRPSIRAGYRTEFKNDGVSTHGTFAGLNSPFALEGEEFPDNGFLLGFSVAAGSAYSSFGLDFDSDIRDGFIRHTGRIVVRLLF